MKTVINVFAFIFSMILVLFLGTKSFANSAHGILMVVKGDVQIQQKDKLTKAKVGVKVVEGDTVITGKDARAKLVMVDKNIINISPDSKFLLEKYQYDPDQNKKGALLNVIYGKVRTTVNQKYDGTQNKFQVKTKSSVAGVRGTDFLVTFNTVTNTSKVVTFEGVVEVGAGLDSLGRIANPVSVTPGQFTVAALGTAPSTPVVMPQSEINSLKEQSVAEAPSTKDSTSGDKKEREPAKQQNNNNSGSSGALDQMGEDSSSTVTKQSGSNSTTTPSVTVPVVTNPNQACPNGQCGVTTVDPTLTQGKTNLLINLQPKQ